MIKIGLTGNIASGKSQVEKIISTLNYPVYDLDVLSHEILENEAKNEIIKKFNTTNRKEIGKIIFNNSSKKKTLENIIYPILRKKIQKLFNLNKDSKLIIISGAVLFESGFNAMFDKIIYVDADINLRLKRLMKRNNLSQEDALLRINSQFDNKDKADIIILNNSTLDVLKNNTIEALKLL